MSKRRISNDILDELIERIERLEELLSNRRDDRLNNINPNNDWCPGCSNDSFCTNNNDDEQSDIFNGCNRRNRRSRSR